MRSRSTRTRGALRAALAIVAAALTAPLAACKTENTANTAQSTRYAPPDSQGQHAAPQEPAFGARIYVSAVNCEMNAADARYLNALPKSLGISVELVFTGIATTDSAVANQARSDLGITVPTRIVRTNELAALQHTGITRLPVALVFKAKQLSSIVSAESMPKTLELVAAAFTPTQNQ